MAVIGGEIGDLTNLKRTFGRQTANVDELLRTVGTELRAAHWHGGARDRFLAAWESEYEPALRNLSVALNDSGCEVGRRCDALLQAGN